jgi:PAS domain S-box-containing protein
MRLFMVGFNLLIVAIAVWQVRESRRHYREQAEATTRNLAQVLEQNVKGTLRQIDLALLSIQDQIEHSPGGPRNPGIEAFAHTRFVRLGMLDALHIADREGRVLHGGSGAPADLARRDFFLALRVDAQAGLVISRPARDGKHGAWAITLARRINDADGRFDGVVFATLATAEFTKAMALVDVGRLGSISLRGENLELLARYPDFQGQEQKIGSNAIADDYRAALRGPAPVVHFTADSTLDGHRRTYTLCQLGSPPFHLQVGLAESEYLRAWRREATFAAAAVALLVALTAVMGWMARAAWLRQLADQDRLAQQEAKYRLLAENALDVIWTADPEGRLTYISPSVQRQRGWAPEAFMALDLDDRTHSAQSAERIRERIAAARNLAPGSQPFEEDALEVTVRHREGHHLEVEIRSRVVWDTEGRVAGLQGVSRDITERRRIEGERDRLILELTQALAEVKQLSGMLPICSHCKKVRNDQGYWSQIEAYLCEHIDATFTHGVCPECAAVLRQELQARRDQKGDA